MIRKSFVLDETFSFLGQPDFQQTNSSVGLSVFFSSVCVRISRFAGWIRDKDWVADYGGL
jgi:hypothetical protein